MKIKVVLTIILIGILSILNAQDEGIIIDKVVAVVGKNVVLKSDVENQYNQAIAQGMTGENLKCEIFEELLFQKLLLDQAQKDSIEVTEKDIEDNLDRRIRYFVSQIGSEEKLEEFYGKSITAIKDEFREVIAKQMLSERMQGQLTQNLKGTPTEIRKFYNELPKDSLPKLNKQFVLEQIVKYPPVDEAEVLAIKEKLRTYRERILKGEKFSTLAVLYSEDLGSARKGGELGFVGRSDLVPEFAAVAFKLKEPGDISRIVETEFGFHIIQLIEKRGELMNLRHILLKPKISTLDLYKAQLFIDSVRTLIINDSINFEDAAGKFSEDESTNKNGGLMINPMTGTSFFSYEDLTPALAYALREVNQKNITKAFKTQDDRGRDVYKIVRIKEIIEPHTANIKQDYQLIQDMCLRDKQQKFLDLWIKRKQADTYIKLEDDYKDCQFKHPGWAK
ncbi:MAG: peptidylprolyl isomerase [Bacteroidales bacterium]|nr:peptidylprolyl isomerase [Bacteroidales bacterium]